MTTSWLVAWFDVGTELVTLVRCVCLCASKKIWVIKTFVLKYGKLLRHRSESMQFSAVQVYTVGKEKAGAVKFYNCLHTSTVESRNIKSFESTLSTTYSYHVGLFDIFLKFIFVFANRKRR